MADAETPANASPAARAVIFGVPARAATVEAIRTPERERVARRVAARANIMVNSNGFLCGCRHRRSKRFCDLLADVRWVGALDTTLRSFLVLKLRRKCPPILRVSGSEIIGIMPMLKSRRM